MATVVSANTITAVATMVLSTFMGTSLVADSCLHLLKHGRRGFLTPERPRRLELGWPSGQPGTGSRRHRSWSCGSAPERANVQRLHAPRRRDADAQSLSALLEWTSSGCLWRRRQSATSVPREKNSSALGLNASPTRCPGRAVSYT